jgi:O-antigen ligase
MSSFLIQLTSLNRMTVVGWQFLFTYISLVPFYYLQPVGFGFDSIPLAILKFLPALILILLVVCTLPQLKLQIPPTCLPVFFFAATYFFICLVSLIGATYPVDGILKFAYYALTGLLIPYLLVAQLSKDQQAVQTVTQTLVIIAALVAFYGIIVFFSSKDVLWESAHRKFNPNFSGVGRLSSTFGNAVVAGAYFSLCLPFAFWAVNREKRSNWKIAYGICTGLILIGLLLTFSRSAAIAAVVASAVYLVPRGKWLFSHVGKPLSSKKFVIVLIFLLTCTATIEGMGFGQPIQQAWCSFWLRTSRLTELSDYELFRLAQYGTTWNVLLAHPSLGVGFGNFTRQFERYKHISTPLSSVTTTDNMYLMVTCETGLFGVATFMALLTALIRVIHTTYRRSQPLPQCDLLLASLAAIYGFLINMVAWDALNQPTVRMTFWILVGIGLSQMRLMWGGNAVGVARCLPEKRGG